jgi:xanthine dehydrogenase accessory factor
VTLFEELRDAIRAEEPVALATIVGGPVAAMGRKLLVRPDGRVQGTLGDAQLDRVVTRDAIAELQAGRTGVRHYGSEGQTIAEDADVVERIDVFVESFSPPPQMVIFGAVDFTAALARVAKVLGYRVTVCDAREIFATPRRFPMADEVVADWPNRLLDRIGATLGPRDAVAVLTHDPKFDVPAIQGALATRVGYIGVMGSRTTHDKRMERLAEVGITEPHDLARVMAPIGIDIGARSPEETAVSICAEIIAMRTGRTVASLRDRSGPIH